MVRRFSEANGLLNDLLDRYEGGTANPIAHPDYDAFPNVVAADVFLRQIARAEAVGAVSLARGHGTRRDQIVHVRLQAADALYHYLGRVPAAQIAQEAGGRLCADIALDWRLVEAAAAIAETWGEPRAGTGSPHPMWTSSATPSPSPKQFWRIGIWTSIIGPSREERSAIAKPSNASKARSSDFLAESSSSRPERGPARRCGRSDWSASRRRFSSPEGSISMAPICPRFLHAI
ncbi:hypothetical protein SAMN05216337_107521 [Bradyrhizobium brasilense]|uniref:Uncharacterized protein n=1 Tax=Bradyrhizobium brasilense TaxID=1419277 RepID=A0A1G7P6Y7_9BRAD|nr:hypothetical protein SAMN05216337_107521 [Bradyrhizobium brasilense]